MIQTEQVANPIEAGGQARPVNLLLYLVLGAAFGVVLTKSEAISWFRIQEMFRFQSFCMYGMIGSAIATAAISPLLRARMLKASARR